MKNLFKFVIVVQLVLFLEILGFGFFYRNTREIDTTDYSGVKKYVDSDEYFHDEKTYRYIEERIKFSAEVEELMASLTTEKKSYSIVSYNV